MSLSIIIGYHNEGEPFLMECIRQIKNTLHITVYEIIIIDDHSDSPLNINEDNVSYIRQSERKGIGYSFDLGVSCAKYDNIFFLACDMRFIDNGWDTKLLNEITLHPYSLVCTTCIGLNKDSLDINSRLDHHWSGATIIVFHDRKSNPRKPKHFRGLVEAQWLAYRGGESYEVPCILGACYAVTKQWYTYVDGFWGHRHWSNLEPLISMKSYLFGGSCRVVPMAETGHIFKAEGNHGTPQESLVYNKMLIAKLLFPDSDRLIGFLGLDPFVKKAKRLIDSNLEFIEQKRVEYLAKTVLPMDEYIKRFNLDYRK